MNSVVNDQFVRKHVLGEVFIGSDYRRQDIRLGCRWLSLKRVFVMVFEAPEYHVEPRPKVFKVRNSNNGNFYFHRNDQFFMKSIFNRFL